jgi:hypothetical protein
LKYRDEYIRYYHEEFLKALKSYGYLKKPPSLLDLQVEILKNGVLEVILGICFNVFYYIDWSSLKFNLFASNETMRKIKKTAFRSEACQKAMKQELPNFFNKGLI